MSELPAQIAPARAAAPSQRDQNRADFPRLAALVDEVRARFPGAKLLAGVEDDREVGRVDDELRAGYAQSLLPPDPEPIQDQLNRQYAADRGVGRC